MGIGSQKKANAAVTWTDVGGSKHAMTVIPTFSNHKANSVRVDSVRICYGIGGGDWSRFVRPVATNTGGKEIWSVPQNAQKYSSYGGKSVCNSWAVGKTFTKQSDGEVVRFNVTVDTGSDHVTASFKR